MLQPTEGHPLGTPAFPEGTVMKKSWRFGSRGPGFLLCHFLPGEPLVRFCTRLNLGLHAWKRADHHVYFAMLLRKSQRGGRLQDSCLPLSRWPSEQVCQPLLLTASTPRPDRFWACLRESGKASGRGLLTLRIQRLEEGQKTGGEVCVCCSHIYPEG